MAKNDAPTEQQIKMKLEAGKLIHQHPLLSLDFTDVGNAERIYITSEGRMRWLEEAGVWYVYTNESGPHQARWVEDKHNTYVMSEAKHCIRKTESLLEGLLSAYPDEFDDDLIQEELIKPIRAGLKAFSNDTKMHAAIRQVRDMPGIRVKMDDFNKDKWLLGALNGTIDLRTGELRESRMEDMLTAQAPTIYNPDAECPIFERSLEQWQPDETVRAFLQIAVGSGATGVNLPNLIVNVGSGRNGKDTFFNAVMNALGREICGVPQRSIFVQSKYEQHSTVVATIIGKRMVVASETSQSDVLDEERVKELTSGGYMTARKIRQDDVTAENTFTIFVHTNNPPNIKGSDTAIWERIREVRWDQTFTGDKVDTTLGAKLASEAEGILAWIVRGARAFYQNGGRLWVPEVIARRTAEYRNEQDTIGRFLADYGSKLDPRFTSSRTLRELYEEWCLDEGAPNIGQKRRKAEMRRHGWEDHVNSQGIKGMRKVREEYNLVQFAADIIREGIKPADEWVE